MGTTDQLDLFRGHDSVDVGLRLLDHQIVGEQDEMLGNVDNLEVREVGGELLVTGMVIGPGGLGVRWPGRSVTSPTGGGARVGRFGRWVTAVWRRLHPERDPSPLVLPLSEVRRIGSAVTVSEWGEHVLAEGAGLELWLRRHLVGRIPGAKGGEDRLGGQPVTDAVPGPGAGLSPDAHLLTQLLGARVATEDDTTLGVVLDVGCVALDPGQELLGPLRVTSLLCGTTQLGGRLGPTEDPQMGPWLLTRIVLRMHQRDRRVPAAAIRSIDWRSGVVTLRD